MQKDVVREAKDFLISYLNGKSCDYEVKHPWRKDSNFVIMHSFRVEAYTIKILEEEGNSLSEAEKTVIKMAAVLHDIGRIERRENHAAISKNIVQAWLDENSYISRQIKDTEKLLNIIKSHSDKDEPEKDLACAIIKDADILDEIGVLSIFMSSNWIDRESPFFFNELLDRLKGFEISFCYKQMARLNTEAARKILSDKMKFIQQFNEQLELELEGTEEFYLGNIEL